MGSIDAAWDHAEELFKNGDEMFFNPDFHFMLAAQFKISDWGARSIIDNVNFRQELRKSKMKVPRWIMDLAK